MLEIIATTVEDAVSIAAGGADRIELVSALSEGGLTPSYGMMEAVINRVEIPVNVMIRPHAKSFYYTKNDIAVMRQDIAMAKKLKANGVVFGTLTMDQQEIDQSALADLLSFCDGLDVTFHRAIDEINPVEGVKLLAKYPQITNILTSGGKTPLDDNVETLKSMIAAGGHIKILVGGGLTRANIAAIMRQVNAPQYHLGTSVRDGKSAFGEVNIKQLEEMTEIVQNNR